MKSTVYFSRIPRDIGEVEASKQIRKLLTVSRLLRILDKGDLVMLKMHFGEKGNTGHIQPRFVRPIVEAVKDKHAKPFLSDTNTLYIGQRHNAVDHLHIAYEHGFSIDKVGCPVIIADGLKGMNAIDITLSQEDKIPESRKRVAIAPDAVHCDALLGLAHVTGHIATGFGACLKNLGMGLSPRRGKLAQHSSQKLSVSDKCNACGTCVKWCPAQAITLLRGSAVIDACKCFGCGYCLCVCPRNAVKFDWGAEPELLQEQIVEHALGIIQGKRDKCAFLNFVQRVTENCDCMSSAGKVLLENAGVLASFDPVAIDVASADLVNEAAGKDVFKHLQPKANYRHQFEYAERLGLGSTSYDLVEV